VQLDGSTFIIKIKKFLHKQMGDRFNQGKLRYDLVPTSANQGIAKVLTFGAQKYGDRNWEKGFKWTSCIASLERHLAAFKSGQDHDDESGLLHMEHLLANAVFLLEFYRTHPELDDRPRALTQKIGLDIDDVLADFVSAYCARFGITTYPSSWHFDDKMNDNMKVLNEDMDFWLNLKPKIDPKDIPFEPHCYVTARSIPGEVTVQWLKKHGFPIKPVHSVGFGKSKAQAVSESGCTWFVDDGYHNYVEINRTHVCCFLMTTPQNQRYNVGYRRICSLKELA
jgi:hypothetical protein